MKLLVAIGLNEDIKKSVGSLAESIKEGSQKGIFSRDENLHLTLAYIGDTDRIDVMKRIVDSLPDDDFKIEFGKFNLTKTDTGDMLWLNVNKSEELAAIRKAIINRMRLMNFSIEETDYNPYIILGKDIGYKNGFDPHKLTEEMPRLSMQASKIQLIKAEKVKGRTVYTEIYFKVLR